MVYHARAKQILVDANIILAYMWDLDLHTNISINHIHTQSYHHVGTLFFAFDGGLVPGTCFAAAPTPKKKQSSNLSLDFSPRQASRRSSSSCFKASEPRRIISVLSRMSSRTASLAPANATGGGCCSISYEDGEEAEATVGHVVHPLLARPAAATLSTVRRSSRIAVFAVPRCFVRHRALCSRWSRSTRRHASSSAARPSISVPAFRSL